MTYTIKKGFDAKQFGLLVRWHYLPAAEYRMFNTVHLQPRTLHLEIAVAWFWVDFDLRGRPR